jgi:uncharacterized membrane protein YkgB
MITLLLRHRERLLTVSLGIIYLWFGGLKFFPGLSPAESLVKQTCDILFAGLIPCKITYFLLAVWEVSIGILFLSNLPKKGLVYMTMVHLLMTFTPLFLIPGSSFHQHFYSLTLIGQYILKNLVLFIALLFILPEKK